MRYVARQPIFDRSAVVVGYELLYRRSASGPAGVTDEDLADVAKRRWGIDPTFPSLVSTVPRNHPALIATTALAAIAWGTTYATTTQFTPRATTPLPITPRAATPSPSDAAGVTSSP